MTERCDAVLDSQSGARAGCAMSLIADQFQPQGYITLHSGIPFTGDGGLAVEGQTGDRRRLLFFFFWFFFLRNFMLVHIRT